MFRLVLPLLILSIYPFLGVAQKDLNTKKLDAKLEAILESTKAAGFSVAIVQGDQIIYAKGFGYRDLDKQLKADENTVYAIGSTTKAFTTGLLGIMEAEKDFSFSESPSTYLPQLTFFNDELNNQVTILDMISHRTGLPRHDFSWYLFPTADKDSLLGRVKYQEPFTGLREKWYYNNFMYLAQGMITEKLTGKTWEENIQQYFIKPLDMTSSSADIRGLQMHPNRATGYNLIKFTTNKAMPYYDISAMSPAGSINSSVNDMAKWVMVWLNDGKYKDQQILPQRYVQQATNPLMLVGNGISDPQFPDQHLNSYGYAWFTSSYKGHYRLEHGGNIDGFSANVSFFPTDDIGIVVLTNQNGSAVPNLVRNTISDMILGVNETDWKSVFEKKRKEAMAQELSGAQEKKETESTGKVSHPLIAYTGSYTHPGYGRFNIDLKNDSLFVHFPLVDAYLEPLHYDIFGPKLLEGGKIDTSDELDLPFAFRTDHSGEISGIDLKFEPTLEALFFKRTPLLSKVETADLKKFEGSYAIQGAEIKVYIKDNLLHLFVKGQPEYALLPTGEDQFIFRDLSGYKATFSPKDGGMELTLNQPNGVFKAFRK